METISLCSNMGKKTKNTSYHHAKRRSITFQGGKQQCRRIAWYKRYSPVHKWNLQLFRAKIQFSRYAYQTQPYFSYKASRGNYSTRRGRKFDRGGSKFF